jgi:hypothetical protein
MVDSLKYWPTTLLGVLIILAAAAGTKYLSLDGTWAGLLCTVGGGLLMHRPESAPPALPTTTEGGVS